MSEEESIKIKKSDLWRYSTFVLIAVVVVGALLIFSGKGTVNGGATTGGNNAGGGSGAVSLSGFLNDESLYPSIGPKDAKHVVVEFSDFQCPYCALASGLPSWSSDYQSQYGDLVGAAGMVQELAEKGEVRFVYVSMSFLGQESVYAAQAGLCANEQGKFWEMHDALFSASTGPQENDGKFSKNNLKKIAGSISGLDSSKFNECLDSDKTLSDVQKVASAASTAASGTPTFFVDGQKVSASKNALTAALA